MVRRPPRWQKYAAAAFEKVSNSEKLREEMSALAKRAQKEYAPWDSFRFFPPPKGMTAEEAWAYLRRFTRMEASVRTPVTAMDGATFAYTVTQELQRRLVTIDRQSGSALLDTGSVELTGAVKRNLVLNGLTEEAIASSQIEGANTTRKAAKDMLLSKRKPRTPDERMIINNFRVMERLRDWKDLPLSMNLLLEMQKTVVEGASDDADIGGRLRTDADNIIIGSADEVIFTPPKEAFFRRELKRFFAYANDALESDEFIHAVVKASVLHFWLAYLHPFVDGNGRTARAIFYWYMLRKKYWLFEYLSVSREIKSARAQYDRAFLHTEEDDNDLTYVVLFMTQSIIRAMDRFFTTLKDRAHEEEKATRLSVTTGQFNVRQGTLLQYFLARPNELIEVERHRNRHGVAYETARSDLFGLVDAGALRKLKRGNKFLFSPNMPVIRRLMKKAG